MLVQAVDALKAAQSVSQIVVAAPPTLVEVVTRLLGPQVQVLPGGAERVDSVRAALAVLDDDIGVVLVHDAARPLAPPTLVDSVAAAVRAGHPAVIPVLAVSDTVKEVDPDGRVLRTLPRGGLRAVQTPQGFRRDVLEAAYAIEDSTVTDDAGLVEALGISVMTVPGAEEAFKITLPVDFVLAEALVTRRSLAGSGRPS
jgi:2-C-methyl-D-erythritol 4-phosphate cytidylyltransferase